MWSNREQKRIRKTFKSLTEAKTWRADALVSLQAGTLRAPDPRTVREAAEEWLAGARAGTVRDRSGRQLKPSTLRGYAGKLHGSVLPELGDFRLSELRRRDVQDLADELLGEGLSPSSVRNTFDPLRAIYRRAIQRELVATNPTTDLDLPSSRRAPVRIATATEARALLEALKGSERAIFATAFYAGLRRGELQALRCSSIDLGSSTVRVERSWDQSAGVIDPKSATSSRTVPMLSVLRDHLDEHLLSTGRSGDELALGRTTSDPFVPSTVRTRVIDAWEDAELDPIRLHGARHTFASLLISAGENPKAVQEFVGHAWITMTFDLYGHMFPGSREEARARMDAYLEKMDEAEPVANGPKMGQ